LTTITQGTGSGGQTRSFKYDSLGRLTRQKLAEQTATINDDGCYVDGGVCSTGTPVWSEAFEYDNRGNVTKRTDARGAVATSSYDISGAPDPLNRLQSITYLLPTNHETTYAIDPAAPVSISYATSGDQTRVASVTTSGVSTETNTYDSYGRIWTYSLALTSRSGYTPTTTYTYDSANRLTQVLYPAQYGVTGNPQHAVAPSYDRPSRLTQVNVDSSTYLGDINYNTASQVTQLKVGAATSNPRIENYSYDSQTGLLTGQTVTNVGATSTYMNLGYSYALGGSSGTLSGKTGQMTNMVDNLDHNRDRKYESDGLGRLVRAKGGIAAGATSVDANWTQAYSYDRYGNKTGVTATGVGPDTGGIDPDGLSSVGYNSATNRVSDSGWQYDNAGNLTRGQDSSGTWQRFQYDAAGRLVKIMNYSGTSLETYTYGATRERFVNETSSGRTYYVWDGSSVIAEYTETTSGTTPNYNKSYVYAGSRLLMTETKASSTIETAEFYHADRLGTKLITNGSSGTSYQQSTFPFGTPFDGESTGYSKQLFTTYDRSAVTGLDYANNRTYSKGEGRFTQVDPLGMGAASGDPASDNLYAYVQNDPISYIDPSGLNKDSGDEVCSYSGDKDANGDPVYDGHIINGKCVSYGFVQIDIYWSDFWAIIGHGAPDPFSDHNEPWFPDDRYGQGLDRRVVQTLGVANGVCNTAASLAGYGLNYGSRWRGRNGKWYEGLSGRGPNGATGARSGILAEARVLKGIGTALNVAGMGLTATQMYRGDISTGKGTRDLIFGGIGFLGPGGALISGAYFFQDASNGEIGSPRNARAVSTNLCHARR